MHFVSLGELSLSIISNIKCKSMRLYFLLFDFFLFMQKMILCSLFHIIILFLLYLLSSLYSIILLNLAQYIHYVIFSFRNLVPSSVIMSLINLYHLGCIPAILRILIFSVTNSFMTSLIYKFYYYLKLLRYHQYNLQSNVLVTIVSFVYK